MLKQLALIFVALSIVVSSAPRLRLIASPSFTVNDKVKINGNVIAEGSGMQNILGCNDPPQGSISITVCGCGVQVKVNLLTGCTRIGEHSKIVGVCDCSNSGCVTDTLTSGYTGKNGWVAVSYNVAAC